jgi:hypothetical protein
VLICAAVIRLRRRGKVFFKLDLVHSHPSACSMTKANPAGTVLIVFGYTEGQWYLFNRKVAQNTTLERRTKNAQDI